VLITAEFNSSKLICEGNHQMAATAHYPEGSMPCFSAEKAAKEYKKNNKKKSTLKQIYLSLLLLFDAYF